MMLQSAAAAAIDEFLRSTQKQRDLSRLAATTKNPRNLFGLESNELAKKARWHCHRNNASRHFDLS